LDEEKSKFAGLAQGNGFWIDIIAQIAVAGKKRRCNTVHLQKKECNKYDPTAAQCF
jgi:hypothetical protein